MIANFIIHKDVTGGDLPTIIMDCIPRIGEEVELDSTYYKVINIIYIPKSGVVDIYVVKQEEEDDY